MCTIRKRQLKLSWTRMSKNDFKTLTRTGQARETDEISKSST